MVKAKFTIYEEETLAEEVTKYPCLYDKTNAGYKEKDRKLNAWKKVKEALSYEEGNKNMYYFNIVGLTKVKVK